MFLTLLVHSERDNGHLPLSIAGRATVGRVRPAGHRITGHPLPGFGYVLIAI